jgi:structure-specific recognition protein 1
VFSRSSGVSQFDGFQQDDFERLSKVFKTWYGVNLEQKEHALRGWNWGKAEFGRSELTFNVQNRPAFEIPYTEITNTNLAGRNEVSVDFMAPAEDEGPNGVNGNGEEKKGKKVRRRLGGAKDQLVEARFYIPGTVTKKEKKEGVKDEDGEDADGEDEDDDGEEQNAANTWYEMLIDKAEIGDVAGDTFASFMDILHLTPRGRFDLDMYEKSFRLRGKTYDYKIQYDSIKKFFLLPKPDDVHTLITIGLDPPLRQGQTRYPFVVMQFKREEDIELDLNITEEDMKEKYGDKLQEHYTGPMYIVLTHLFRGLAGKKIISPSKDFESRHGQSAIKCSIKANEGHLYCMDKSFMFVPKPATYVAFDNVAQVTMSRVGGAVSASRTFDITITLRQGGEHQFSNINRYVSSEELTDRQADNIIARSKIHYKHSYKPRRSKLETRWLKRCVHHSRYTEAEVKANTHSSLRYSKQRSKSKHLTPPRTKSCQASIAVVPMRTLKKQTRTSERMSLQIQQKSSTRIRKILTVTLR